MGQLGFSEMLVIFIVALLVFGPKKLPELGKSLGKGIREFKKATEELKSSWDDQVKDITTPLNEVKSDINNIGQDMKSDFYKHLEASAETTHETPASPTPSSHPSEPAVPKEHV
ncbi:MAG TPA: twin-arginine translocase TatA/TatE family subunit [Terriglobia bacterium]|nr:twin-arginine translocase TatA/TatE family subunit [Terriglobia bacterium]